jgi:hypothetical protein
LLIQKSYILIDERERDWYDDEKEI